MKLWMVFIFFWIPNIVSAGSVTLAWDASPSAEVAGYKIYSGLSSRIYNQNFDTGNVLQFGLQNTVPKITYFFAATAYTAQGLESDYSDEISYTPPLPSTSLMLGSNLLTLTVFPNATFDVQSSTDLHTWNLFQTVSSTSNSISIPLSENLPVQFFRAKWDSSTVVPLAPLVVGQVAKAAVIKRESGISPPPLPPAHLGFWKRLKLFFRYRPGHHPDLRKGAERLMEHKKTIQLPPMPFPPGFDHLPPLPPGAKK